MKFYFILIFKWCVGIRINRIVYNKKIKNRYLKGNGIFVFKFLKV